MVRGGIMNYNFGIISELSLFILFKKGIHNRIKEKNNEINCW